MPRTLATKYRTNLVNAILGYLLRYGSIDPPTAAAKFECYNLQSVTAKRSTKYGAPAAASTENTPCPKWLRSIK